MEKLNRIFDGQKFKNIPYFFKNQGTRFDDL